MPTKLILIRHGQTVDNAAKRTSGWTDSPLSELGFAQAAQMAAYVAERYQLDRLYSSPLQRARHTAEAIGRLVGLTPVLRADLKEVNFGVIETLTKPEIAATYPEIWANWDAVDDPAFTWPEGESLAGFYRRVAQAFREIIAASPGQTVAVVAHGGVFGAYLADLLEGQPWLWRQYVQNNCAVSEVHAGNGRVSVACYNECSFLTEPGAEPDEASLARDAVQAASDGAIRSAADGQG